MTRPAVLPDWATNANYGAGPYSGNANKAQPAAGVIAEGFDPNAGIPAEWLNWLFSNDAAWIDYLDSLFDPPTTSDDVPQVQYKDAGGNLRHLIDHNGYPALLIGKLEESWMTADPNLSATQSPITLNPIWQLFSVSTATLNIISGAGFNDWPSAIVSTTATLNSRCSIGTFQQPVKPSLSYMSAVFETYASIANTSGKNFIGFANNIDHTAASQYIRFRQATGTANWQIETAAGAGPTTVDTGVAAAGSTFVLFRIEVHGSGSPYGAKTRFFMNGVLKGEITTTIPAVNLYYVCETDNSNSVQTSMSIGPVRGQWNLQLTSPAL